MKISFSDPSKKKKILHWASFCFSEHEYFKGELGGF